MLKILITSLRHGIKLSGNLLLTCTVGQPSEIFFPKHSKKDEIFPLLQPIRLRSKATCPHFSLYIKSPSVASQWLNLLPLGFFSHSPFLSDSCPLITRHVLCWSEAGPFHRSCREGWAGTLWWSLTVPGSGGGTRINYNSHGICHGTAAPLHGDVIRGDPLTQGHPPHFITF